MSQEVVAVTGATGFIGGHLLDRLVERKYRVQALVRRPEEYPRTDVEVRRADALDEASLTSALDGVHTAYYLIHSMKEKQRSFEELDRTAAQNFLRAAETVGVKRIIYLGGLGEAEAGLSKHLSSRTEVGHILQSGRVRTTVLRAAIILGPGSASWEMLRQLVERLPVMITPRWVETRCQPISLRDVLGYLVGCIGVEATAGETFDIGGPDILTYRQMMLELADVLGRRLYIYGIPVLTPRLSSYWVDVVTDVPSSVARPLIDGLRNEVVCRENRIRSLVPITMTPYRQAIELALQQVV